MGERDEDESEWSESVQSGFRHVLLSLLTHTFLTKPTLVVSCRLPEALDPYGPRNIMCALLYIHFLFHNTRICGSSVNSRVTHFGFKEKQIPADSHSD